MKIIQIMSVVALIGGAANLQGMILDTNLLEKKQKQEILPSTLAVYKYDKRDELGGHIHWDYVDTDKFQECLQYNPWVVNEEDSDGLTIGEFIIDEFVREYTTAANLAKFKENYVSWQYQNSKKNKSLQEIFRRVLVTLNTFEKGGYNDVRSRTLLKIDKRLSRTEKYCPHASLSEITEPLLNRRLECSYSFYSNTYVINKKFERYEDYSRYDSIISPKINKKQLEIKDIELHKVSSVWKLFDHIERKNPTQALALVKRHPWLSYAVKAFSSESNAYGVDITAIECYEISPLCAIAYVFIDDTNVAKKKEDFKKLFSLLLVHGADCTFQRTLRHKVLVDLSELLNHPKCRELRALVSEYNQDRQAFYDSIYPLQVKKVEEVPVEDQGAGKDAQAGENKEEVGQKNRRIISEKYASLVIPTLTVCSLVTGAALGNYYAHKRHNQAQERKKKSTQPLKSTEKSSSDSEKPIVLESTAWSPGKKFLVGGLSVCTALMGYLFYKGKSSTNKTQI
ncbi:hypothetical protein H0X06_02600 [Candidatus Dependentiae bacterium]|nr:hypothetical protein [Candidatus Dependentiae bacterium]